MSNEFFVEKPDGIVKTIAAELFAGPKTKEQLFAKLCEKFGEKQSYRSTINVQLRQTKVGDKNNAILTVVDGVYTLTRKE